MNSIIVMFKILSEENKIWLYESGRLAIDKYIQELSFLFEKWYGLCNKFI